jgi:hypothetical protein
VVGIVESTLWAAVVVPAVAVRQLCLMRHYRSVKKRGRVIRWRLKGVGLEL